MCRLAELVQFTGDNVSGLHGTQMAMSGDVNTLALIRSIILIGPDIRAMFIEVLTRDSEALRPY